jgi:hypothetical protein
MSAHVERSQEVSVLCLQNRSRVSLWQTFHSKVANLSGKAHVGSFVCPAEEITIDLVCEPA